MYIYPTCISTHLSTYLHVYPSLYSSILLYSHTYIYVFVYSVARYPIVLILVRARAWACIVTTIFSYSNYNF